jgi:hypothetical protein
MNKEQLKKTLNSVAKTTEELFKKDGSIAPVLFVYHTVENKDGTESESCAIVPIISMEHREAILFAMGKAFLKNNRFKKVQAIALVSEAWMSVQDSKSEQVNHVLPSQDPKRKEIINIIGMTDSRESAMLIFDIDRRVRKMIKNEKASSMSKIENRLLDRFWQGMGMIVRV